MPVLTDAASLSPVRPQDGAGVTHLQVQFQLRGPNGAGAVGRPRQAAGCAELLRGVPQRCCELTTLCSLRAGVATTHADAVKEGGSWVLQTLYVDVGSPVPQRLVLLAPESTQTWLAGGSSAYN